MSTDHRASAEELRARLAAIVESSQDAVISKSLDGTILSWNAAAERLFGYGASEAIGKPITLIIPPERQDEETEILARIAAGDRVDHFETVRLSKQGRRIDISLTVSPIRDDSGRVIGASKAARDITERRVANQALADANRRKDEFIALLAHELRNPLASIRNGLQVLRMSASDSDAARRAATLMDRQLGHVTRLVDDLLDVARIGQHKMELRRTRVLLTDALRSAVEAVRPAIEDAAHELTLSFPADPIYLDADLTRLAQVFTNLLANGAKFTPRGGHIWLAAEWRERRAVVTVRDNGIGIPPEILPLVFQMFSQPDRRPEASSGGLGLGLALVQGLVEMHGGTVTAQSPGRGQGSTFTVSLPALERQADRATPASSDEAAGSPGGRRRILVVDDNRDSADSMTMLLKLMGNDVLTAYDGAAGVAAAERFQPDVVLMDLGMPRPNGFEATRLIRAQPWGQRMAIIALTGWGQDDDRERSRAAGCSGHLVKPVNLSELEALLARLQAEGEGSR